MNPENNKGTFEDLPAFIHEQASPYLSPFQGLYSLDDSHSRNYVPEVQLQSQNENPYAYSEPSEDFPDRVEDPSLSQKEEQLQEEEIPSIDLKKLGSEPQKVELQSSEQINIKMIVNFLVQNDGFSEKELFAAGKSLYQDSQKKLFIFKAFLPKFLKLRKTKEQMTKYCMRKAFKFIGELNANTKRRKIGKISKKQSPQSNLELDMPFKKNSSDKTMNSHFLSKVFSQKDFVRGYQKFLRQFNKMMREDNESKIDFLVHMIEKYWQSNQLEKISNIKRLPWTQSILSKTQALAHKLEQYANGSIDTK